MNGNNIKIIAFYEFKKLENLTEIRERLRSAMQKNSIVGTIILAAEGFNATVSGKSADVDNVIPEFENILETVLNCKTSYFAENPFKRAFVKIKPEIVTLKQKVDFNLSEGTHVNTADWNELIEKEDVIVLDTRNDYEFQVGTFSRALNPKTEKFSDLPAFVKENLDPEKHKIVAMFCTGGIRCEKFAPYLKGLGFEKVFQLEGGILKYLEEIPAEKSLWKGECFVFDERISVDENLEKGKSKDLSFKLKQK